MRVLVTRPEPAASRTAARVRALGMEPVLLPVSKTRLDPAALERVRDRSWSAIAVTSANAIAALAAKKGVVGVWRDLPFFAVGTRTGEAARAAGFADVRTGSGRGRDLASAVAAGLGGGLLLYCAGEPRSPEFEAGLVAAGIGFETVVCYRMEAVAHSAEAVTAAAATSDVILLYSRESASRFFRLLPEAGSATLAARAILCISDAVAGVVPETFRPIVRVSSEPNEEGILEILATVQT